MNSKPKKAESEVSKKEMSALSFGLNRLASDMDLFKKIFSKNKLTAMEESQQKVKTMGFEVEGLKIAIQNMVSKSDIEDVKQRFNEYTPMMKFRDLLDDVRDNVKKE